MDFRELVYVTTVADLKSVTAAAKKLYISQPSLSQIISKVEKETGVKLFDRTTYPISLTYAGEKYVETARKILMMYHNLQKELMDIGIGSKGRINLGIPNERAGYMLPPVLAKFRAQYPDVEITTLEQKSDGLIEALLKGEINFMILPRQQNDLPSGLTTELIYKEKLLLVAGQGVITDAMLRDTQKASVDLKKVSHLPFIHLKKGHAIRKKVDQILKKHQISPPIIMETSSCISSVQLAAVGYGLAIVPKRAVDVLGGAEHFYCYQYEETEKTWDVNVIYKTDAYLDQSERYFIELMKTIFG